MAGVHQTNADPPGIFRPVKKNKWRENPGQPPD
jgi:hypothetical protein